MCLCSLLAPMTAQTVVVSEAFLTFAAFELMGEVMIEGLQGRPLKLAADPDSNDSLSLN